jgi:gluconokinase
VNPVRASVVVMGVSGCGKSTVGRALADALGSPYLEGDAFHSPHNVARMAAGVALTDDDRQGWLRTLADRLGAAQREGSGIVLSCSALKRGYRDLLRSQAPGLRFVHLAGSPELLAQRVATRQHAYMPASLLNSQLAALEPPGDDESALTLDITQSPDALVQVAREWLQRSDSHAAAPR